MRGEFTIHMFELRALTRGGDGADLAADVEENEDLGPVDEVVGRPLERVLAALVGVDRHRHQLRRRNAGRLLAEDPGPQHFQQRTPTPKPPRRRLLLCSFCPQEHHSYWSSGRKVLPYFIIPLSVPSGGGGGDGFALKLGSFFCSGRRPA